MMDDATIKKISDSIVKALDAMAGALIEDPLFDESGVEKIRLITQRLVNAELGREPTAEEQEAILARVEAHLKGGE